MAKEEEELRGEEEKMSQVMWVDPIEEVERRKLKERVNALETQDLNNTVTTDHGHKGHHEEVYVSASRLWA